MSKIVYLNSIVMSVAIRRDLCTICKRYIFTSRFSLNFFHFFMKTHFVLQDIRIYLTVCDILLNYCMLF